MNTGHMFCPGSPLSMQLIALLLLVCDYLKEEYNGGF